jgi:hypothetical protein
VDRRPRREPRRARWWGRSGEDKPPPYYVPVVDNLLDTLATPASLVAGTVVSAAVMTDVPPMVKWTAAVIAGGGVAGLAQAGTAMLRAKSTIFTGGIGNVVVARVRDHS